MGALLHGTDTLVATCRHTGRACEHRPECYNHEQKVIEDYAEDLQIIQRSFGLDMADPHQYQRLGMATRDCFMRG